MTKWLFDAIFGTPMKQMQKFWLRAEFDFIVMETCLFKFQYKEPTKGTEQEKVDKGTEQEEVNESIEQEDKRLVLQECGDVGTMATNPSNNNKQKRLREDEEDSEEQKLFENRTTEAIKEAWGTKYVNNPQVSMVVKKASKTIENLIKKQKQQEEAAATGKKQRKRTPTKKATN